MLDQMKQIEDELELQDAEVERLRKGANGIYHGDRSDKIDLALGNYLCEYPEREKLKILFLRESEGVY